MLWPWVSPTTRLPGAFSFQAILHALHADAKPGIVLIADHAHLGFPAVFFIDPARGEFADLVAALVLVEHHVLSAPGDGRSAVVKNRDSLFDRRSQQWLPGLPTEVR